VFEMFVDSMVDMVEKGRITGARKNIDKYKIVATIALGTKKTYDFIAAELGQSGSWVRNKRKKRKKSTR